MLHKAFIASLLLAAGAVPAVSAEAVDSVFQVSFHYAGVDQVLEATSVPLLPGNACYNWYIRLADGLVPTSASERLILPVPLADWGDAATNPDDGIEIVEGGKVAIRTLSGTPDADGWITDGWCVAAGDPTGGHRIEVTVDGDVVASYDFEVLAPDEYTWPAIPQPDPSGRSVDNSW